MGGVICRVPLLGGSGAPCIASEHSSVITEREEMELELERRQQEERQKGRQLLRRLVMASSPSSLSSQVGRTGNDGSGDGGGGSVDWASVIKTAEELHTKEQEYEQQRQWRRLYHRPTRYTTTSRLTIYQQRMRKKHLRQRRKEDALGSFSANMLTYRPNGEIISAPSHKLPHNHYHHQQQHHDDDEQINDFPIFVGAGGIAVARTASNTTASSRDDHSSGAFSSSAGASSFDNSEIVFSRSWDEGMTTIIEDDDNNC